MTRMRVNFIRKRVIFTRLRVEFLRDDTQFITVHIIFHSKKFSPKYLFFFNELIDPFVFRLAESNSSFKYF
jgi:hypothetical protein